MFHPALRAGWLAHFLVLILLGTIVLSFPSSISADTDLDVGGEARVSYTGGDSIRVRSQPSYSSSVVASVPEGWLVSVLDGPVSDGAGSQWYKVVARGQTGYMVSDYLARPSGSSGSPATTSGEVISNAWVVDGSLNLRAGASTGTAIVLVLPNGAQVGVTGSAQNGFTPVRYNGVDGWAYSTYLSNSQPGSSTPPPSSGSILETRYATSNLNLRSGAGTSFGVVTVIPSGGEVGITGSQANGYFPVRYNGTNGFAAASFLSTSAPGSTTPPPSSGSVLETRYATTNLNLRSGSGTSFGVVTVIPSGGEVGITGSQSNGYFPVRYNGTNGFAAATYLSTTAPGSSAPPSSTIVETRYATTNLNLRSGAGTSFGVLTVIPSGGEVGITGSQSNGYFPVRYNGTSGFAAANWLSTTDPGAGSGPGPGNTVGGSLVWPVSGGTWEIIQGYNGGTHQNRSSSASYLYSLDIAKVGGNTAGTPVYAPASGTVLWTSGGLLIDMGNGYGIAMFHITIDGSIGRGTRLSQGQYVGFISGPGGTGYAVTPHIDLTLWQIPNGGGSPRISTPFTGGFAISGQSFAATGAYNTHGGTRFTP